MSKFLDDFVKLAKEDGHNLFRISEIVNGSEPETAQVSPANDCCNCYSIAKVFTQVAIGILEDEGKLSTDERIVDIFPEYVTEDINPDWQKVTVDMVLRHYCGFRGGDMDIDRYDIHENFGDDFLFYIFNNSMDHEPDKRFSYSDSAYYLLARVASKKCGTKMDDFLWDKLFMPLKFQEVAWSHCPMGYPMGATGLYIKSCDLAKFGEMLLNKGEYKGQRIVSERWVNKALERQYDLYPTGAGNGFYKGGMFGQQLVMVPDTGRVAAWHCAGGGNSDLVKWVSEYKN